MDFSHLIELCQLGVLVLDRWTRTLVQRNLDTKYQTEYFSFILICFANMKYFAC